MKTVISCAVTGVLCLIIGFATCWFLKPDSQYVTDVKIDSTVTVDSTEIEPVNALIPATVHGPVWKLYPDSVKTDTFWVNIDSFIILKDGYFAGWDDATEELQAVIDYLLAEAEPGDSLYMVTGDTLRDDGIGVTMAYIAKERIPDGDFWASIYGLQEYHHRAIVSETETVRDVWGFGAGFMFGNLQMNFIGSARYKAYQALVELGIDYIGGGVIVNF